MNFQPVNFVYSVNICNGVGVAAVGKPAGLEPHCTSSHGAATYSQENRVPPSLTVSLEK